MSTQYRLVQSGKTASGGCSAGPRFVRAVAPRIKLINHVFILLFMLHVSVSYVSHFQAQGETFDRETDTVYTFIFILQLNIMFILLTFMDDFMHGHDAVQYIFS
jgi:hypothetical protein